MSDHVSVDVFDSGEALLGPIDEDDVQSISRERFIRRLALAGGSALLGGVLIGGLPRLAVSAPSQAQDVEVFNFALVLEYLQAAFYSQAAQSGVLEGELSEFVDVVREHELRHVDYLRSALGDEARESPTFSFGDALRDAETFAATAVTLEDLGVAAYNGQATNLTRKRIADAAKILSVDARHAAWIRSIVGKTPASQPTDRALTGKQVSARLDQLGFVEGS
jgi:ferritin-like protein